MVMNRGFKLPENKKLGYYKAVGQELPTQSKSLNTALGVRMGGEVF